MHQPQPQIKSTNTLSRTCTLNQPGCGEGDSRGRRTNSTQQTKRRNSDTDTNSHSDRETHSADMHEQPLTHQEPHELPHEGAEEQHKRRDPDPSMRRTATPSARLTHSETTWTKRSTHQSAAYTQSHSVTHSHRMTPRDSLSHDAHTRTTLRDQDLHQLELPQPTRLARPHAAPPAA